MRWRTTAFAAAVTLVGIPAGVAVGGGTVTAAGVGALAPALAVAVLLARRWPLAALLVSWATVVAHRTAGLVEVGWVWPASAAFALAVVAGRAGWAYLVGAVGVAFAANWEWSVAGHQPEWVAAHVGVEALWLAVVLAGATAYRDRRRWQEEAAARLRQAEHEREVDSARRRAEERVRVAREVHDVVAHTLAAVGVHLNVALDTIETEPAEARAALRLAQDVRGAAMADLKSLVGVLRDGTAPVAGLDGIDDLVRRSGLAVTLDETGDRGGVPAPASRAAYRIVQEALTNSVRHGAATRADVVLRYGPRELTVAVTDNGAAAGDAVRGGEGHGILGMRERVAALGGTLTAGPAYGGGFTVRATIPTEV
ncbi:sensor histidine kinase [Phytohabitans kaempferiae]|uniref:histidine kinase n=1 Tax=Phytohabitans kaempferiae TaxID=1620943 RepID=A0ABV6MBI7_9ACTN